MQIDPPPELSLFIKHCLVLENDTLNGVVHRLIPDGNPGIVFHYETPLLQNAGGNTPYIQQPKSFIYGQVTATIDLISEGRIGMIVVVLQPYAINSLTNIPAHHFTNTIRSLNEIWGQPGSQLEKAVLLTREVRARLELIQTFLTSKFQTAPDPIVKNSIDWMKAHPGSASIHDLVAQLPIGERQLERAFKTHVGVSPKLYANMIRMQFFLRSMRRPGEENLTNLAYSSGYYDQAHLVRTFKNKSGITPSRYLQVRDFLALNFIQFSKIK
jgi:AraC-like DNA-binding protein